MSVVLIVALFAGGWIALLLLYNVFIFIERTLNTQSKVKFHAAVTVQADAAETTTVKPKQSLEQKAMSADKTLEKHKDLIDSSSMDDDAKRMASRHAEGKHLKSLKDMIDGS